MDGQGVIISGGAEDHLPRVFLLTFKFKMKKKIKRQALNVSLYELNNLKIDLAKQVQELQKELRIKNWEDVDYSQRFQIGIINKTPECCDSWRIE